MSFCSPYTPVVAPQPLEGLRSIVPPAPPLPPLPLLLLVVVDPDPPVPGVSGEEHAALPIEAAPTASTHVK